MTQTATTLTSVAVTPHEQILGIGIGYWQSRALAVAAELKLADLLADGPLSVDILAERTKTDSLSLFRLMRALESIGIFTQIKPRVFANTPASECLRKGGPASLWAWVRTILSTGSGHFEAGAGLMDSIQTGRAAFDEIYGCGFWQFLQRNPEKSAHFKEAVHSLTVPMTPVVTAAFDWSRFPTIADIGGGIGTQLVDILNAHPSCRSGLGAQAASFSVAAFGKKIHEPSECGEKHHPTKDDIYASHDRFLLARCRLQPIKSTHAPIPHSAVTVENGRSLRNWPNSNPPAATFAASASLSMSTPRCSSLHSNIVITTH